MGFRNYSFFQVMVLLFVGLLVFLPTLVNGFQTEWDDGWQLLENPYVSTVGWGAFWQHFLEFYKGQYSPVNTLIYRLVYALSGFEPMAYHVLCLGVHLCNVVLVFQIVRQVFHRIVGGTFSENNGRYAFFVALLFAVHPLQVESVAWISASKVLLYSFLTLLAIWAYLEYLKELDNYWLCVVVLAYMVGFGLKEQAIILPFTLMLFDLFYGRFRGVKPNLSILGSKVVLEKIPFLLLGGLFWYFSLENGLGVVVKDGAYPIGQRLMMGMHSVTDYVFRFLAPVKLYYFYFFPVEVGEKLPLSYWFNVVIAVIIGGTVWRHYRNGDKVVVFGFLFFMVNMILVLHLLPMPRKMITADRYMYLGIIGLSMMLVWYMDRLYAHFVTRGNVIHVLVLAYLVFLGIHTFVRTRDWKNSDQIKANVLELIEKRERKDSSSIINLKGDG